ncbi:acetyl-CoA synthetase [Actinocorallia herbida]|uniref:Acetyl-CoA synthetase n=1 Tax=Actinocorallia herbida TaxID=58109 RepID=A0A3N1D229_9ACTN|nr:AMP-binding protein [Actinocorallia herbida]ROO87546.1 acetyl-CoA synthetase [Actinocorallia herbida]
MTLPTTDVDRWLARFGAPDARAAELLCDGHPAEAVAFTVIEPDLSARDLTYGELADASRRFATALAERGVGRGDGVAVLMGKSRDLVVALLGIWRLGAVHVPLFTAFATPAIEFRVRASGARVIVADPDQRHKIDSLDGLDVIEGGSAFDDLVAAHPPFAGAVAVGGDGTLVQLFTSGTTGQPKGVPVPVRALAAFCSYLRYGLDVTDDDVFWNAADPGWAYGLYYAILGPLALGKASLLLRAGFSPEVTVQVLRRYAVTNLAAAPTVYRGLSKDPSVRGIRLRRASSAGEPLTPDVPQWSREALGVEVRDHYGQTELGMVIANGWHDAVRAPVKPGSMGRALPGFTAGIVDGQIAIGTDGSPLLWFAGYTDAPDKTAERFTPDGHWYLTADTGREDEDGCFFFTARDDDVVIMAGYRIGPFDVESVLITHPAVADVAVIGVPDELRGEVLHACVVLAEGRTASNGLTAELQELVKRRFAAHAYPRAVHYLDRLPKTPSGKVQRFVLRGRYGSRPS